VTDTANNGEHIVQKLLELGRLVRDAVLLTRGHSADLAQVHKHTTADTIYEIDRHAEPAIVRFCEHWSQELPLVLVAEGIGPRGQEGKMVFPAGMPESSAQLRLIIDPIDGTRELMYDKRSAWFLAGVAPNRGDATQLSDVFAAVQVELPTSKQSAGDILWAVKGQGAKGLREIVHGAVFQKAHDLVLRPSQADNLNHAFASVVNFFPGCKELASRLMEEIIRACVGQPDVARPLVFDDQYLSTGGQLYELIMGHDRFIADVRPWLFKSQGLSHGMCAHPYDLAASLIAREAGVVLTDGMGGRMDAPLDVNTPVAWAGFANPALRARIEPVMTRTLEKWLNQQSTGLAG
jgi:fructose-1,6-bisphosphatase/inositol monophosphatase family enzyme